MKQFREDNTEGYTPEQLATLNTLYEQQLTGHETPDECQWIAERVLREFDTEAAE